MRFYSVALFGLSVWGLISLVIRGIDLVVFDVPTSEFLGSSSGPSVLTACAVVALFGLSLRSPAAGSCLVWLLFAVTRYAADQTVGPPMLEAPSTCLVTGANSGIGLAVAEALFKEGHVVILGCRSQKKCEAARDQIMLAAASPMTGTMNNDKEAEAAALARLRPIGGLDLADLAQVKAFVGALAGELKEVSNQANNQAGAVQALINNAGLVPVGKKLTAQGLEAGFGVMHVGHHALVRWLQEARLLAPDASVVQVSSDAARLGAFDRSLTAAPDGEGDLRGEVTTGCRAPEPFCVPPRVAPTMQFRALPEAVSQAVALLLAAGDPRSLNFGSYARAKLTNVLYARELARRQPGLWVTSVHPGMVHTPMAQNVPSLLPTGAAQDAILSLMLRPPQSAAHIVLAGAVRGRNGGTSGAFLNGMAQPVPDYLMPPDAHDDALAKKLWEVTERLVDTFEERS